MIMAFFDSSQHQLVTQRAGPPSNHTQQIGSFRRFQWRPWRLREADVFYSYRARIEPKARNVVKTVALNGSYTGISVMKPGILSRSMESERTKIFLVKESAPVVSSRKAHSEAKTESVTNTVATTKETVRVVRRANSITIMESERTRDSQVKEPPPVIRRVNINTASNEGSTEDVHSPTSALTTQLVPIAPQAQNRKENKSTLQQNLEFPYPDPRKIVGLTAFKFRMIELTCLERDTIRSEEARKRIFGNCRSTAGANPSTNRNNKQLNSLPATIQRGRPKSAANGNQPYNTHDLLAQPKSATTTQLYQQRSSSSSVELTNGPTKQSLLLARSKSCQDMTHSSRPTSPSEDEEYKLLTDDSPLIGQPNNDAFASIGYHHTSTGDLLGMQSPASQSLGVLEEFLEGGSPALGQHLELSASSERNRASPCEELQQLPHKSNKEEDKPEHSNPGALLPPSSPPTETNCTNGDVSSQKQPKVKSGRRQRKTSSDNGRRKSIECTQSKSNALLPSSKPVPHSKTSGKTTKKSKSKRHHRRTA